MSTIRLNKLLATRGIGARRKCDRLIESGAVRVNGEVVKAPGARVVEGRDRITVDGRPLPGPPQHRYLMLNKPVGVITTLNDPEGRRTIADLIPKEGRLYPVGRLDADTSGLLIVTNDGELAHHLMHPRYGLTKFYRVLLARDATDEQLARLAAGVEFEPGMRSAPARVRRRDPVPRGAVIEIALHEGRHRQVRRMCEAVGLTVLGLHRWAYGPLKLGELSRGIWRELSEAEVAALRGASARPQARPAGAGPMSRGRGGRGGFERPRFERPPGEGPRSERPRGESPRFERPSRERPGHERPRGDVREGFARRPAGARGGFQRGRALPESGNQRSRRGPFRPAAGGPRGERTDRPRGGERRGPPRRDVRTQRGERTDRPRRGFGVQQGERPDRPRRGFGVQQGERPGRPSRDFRGPRDLRGPRGERRGRPPRGARPDRRFPGEAASPDRRGERGRAPRPTGRREGRQSAARFQLRSGDSANRAWNRPPGRERPEGRNRRRSGPSGTSGRRPRTDRSTRRPRPQPGARARFRRGRRNAE